MTSVTIKVLSYHMSERKLGYLQMFVIMTSIKLMAHCILMLFSTVRNYAETVPFQKISTPGN